MAPLELWGGIECTVNRVRGRFHSQLEQSGHGWRDGDLDRFAALGIRKLRYPILWELHASGSETIDWRWAAGRLERLASLDIAPIVGLVHHGSGPQFTHLLDERFASGLAAYADALAHRFPLLEWFTPVNEPLTTARFSALYGHWYPHARDDASFIRALLNQTRATVLAMRAVRAVNPRAKLVQTDDLGKTWSTQVLTDQAQFDNERRWLTWDLLCGRVDREHSLWGYLTGWGGATERELEWFVENRCLPDVLGINHYITSERFLDERIERYPAACHGGNGRQTYADVEAARVLEPAGPGIAGVLKEAWQRYGLPLAITEAHLGCTREEQLRWLHEVWHAAARAQEAGIDVRAVTVWALLGSYDWDSLLTRAAGHYEPGAFDLRGMPNPRPTAITHLARELADGVTPQHPVLATPGWWRRESRLAYPSVAVHAEDRVPTQARARAVPLWIVGASGTLGKAFARICDARGLDYRITSRADVDICDAAAVEGMLSSSRAWAVINAAGYVRVDDAERECDRCHRENVLGPATLAAACERHGAQLICFSSDLVFNGRASAPYVESAGLAPLNVYGKSKAQAESSVLARHPEALVIRTSSFFGPWDPHNFLARAVDAFTRGIEFTAIDDVRVSPTYVPDLVHACLDLMIDRETGVWHLVNQGDVTWTQFARSGAEACRVAARSLRGLSVVELGLPAARPSYSVLGSERGLLLPPLENAMARYAAAYASAPAVSLRQFQVFGSNFA